MTVRCGCVLPFYLTDTPVRADHHHPRPRGRTAHNPGGQVSEHNWYEDRRNLATVARWMGKQGDTAEDIAYMIEKPQKFEDEWRRANIQMVTPSAPATESGQA